MFYFSINFGSTISTLVTPVIRNAGGYAIAFAVPAALLLVATVLFIIGKKAYRIVCYNCCIFPFFVAAIKGKSLQEYPASVPLCTKKYSKSRIQKCTELVG